MEKNLDPIDDLIPLREPTFYILLSLAPGHVQPSEQKHGYAIIKDVEELSGGKIRLSTGTLYEALARLLDQELIERVEESPSPAESQKQAHPGKPRKTYRLAPRGRQVLEAEISRLNTLIKAALQKQVGEGWQKMM